MCLVWAILASSSSSSLSAQSMYTVAAPPGDGTSTGLRGPNGIKEHAYHRTLMFVSASELTLVPVGMKITQMGFVFTQGASRRVTGNFSLYMANTSGAGTVSTDIWAEVVSQMTAVYNGTFTVPDTSGVLDLNLSSPFIYSGKSLHVAYEFQSPGPYATMNAVLASNTAVSSSIKSGYSSAGPPSVLNDVSAFRPVLRFGFPFPAVRWSKVASGTGDDFRSLDIVDDSSAWVCASSGGVYQTTDRGLSWLSAGRPANSARAILGLTKKIAIVLTEADAGRNKMIRTTDAGVSWMEIYQSDSSAPVSVVWKTSGSSIWGLAGPVNDSMLVVNSNDRGSSWLPAGAGLAVPRELQVKAGSFCRLGNVIWFGTSGPAGVGDRVYKSIGGPKGPWTFSSTGKTNLVALAFSSSDSVGFAANSGRFDALSKTTDGGLTWASVEVPGMGEVRSLACFTGGKDFWAATTTGIWHTSDDGVTWERTFSASGSSGDLACLRFFLNFQDGLAVGSGGSIVRGSWVVKPAMGIARGDEAPVGFRLESNYPNPFNSNTVIGYRLTANAPTTLRVYDMLGRRVATLVQGNQGPGEYRVKWDGSSCASGVYYYELRTSTLAAVRPMLLLK